MAQKGSHIQFKHPNKKGRVTVPHPKRDIPIGTLRSTEKKSRKKKTGGIGSSFDDFLKEDGIYQGVTARAIKRVLARQLGELMRREEISKTLHIEGLTEDGEAIPEPSSLEEVMSDPDNRSGVAILVSVKTEQPKAVRVNVTLPGDVLEQIDKYAEAHGFTRSGFLTQAAKKLMGEAA